MLNRTNPDILIGIAIASLFWMGVVVYSTASSPNANQANKGCEGSKTECAKAAVDERLANYTGWLAVLTAALVLTALGQGYFLLRADKTTRTAANAAVQSADSQIAVEGARLLFYPTGHNYWDAVGQWANRWPNSPQMGLLQTTVFCTFIFKNYGKTPATIKEVNVVLKKTMEMPDDIFVDHPMLSLPTEIVIESGQPSSEFKAEISQYFSMAEAIQMREGKGDVWIYGRVVYDDVFGREGTQRFLYKIIPTGGFSRILDQTKYRKI